MLIHFLYEDALCTVQFWHWQPSAIRKQYCKIITHDTKNLCQELSSRPIIILNMTTKVTQKLNTFKTKIATNEILELLLEMWT